MPLSLHKYIKVTKSVAKSFTANIWRTFPIFSMNPMFVLAVSSTFLPSAEKVTRGKEVLTDKEKATMGVKCDRAAGNGTLTRAGADALLSLSFTALTFFHHYHLHLCSANIMTCGKRLSDDLQAIIVRKFTEDNLTTVEIAKSLRCPYTTIQGIWALWKHTGTVSTQKLKNRGRPRIMGYEDNQVCCVLFHLTSYLSFLVPFRPFGKSE